MYAKRVHLFHDEIRCSFEIGGVKVEREKVEQISPKQTLRIAKQIILFPCLWSREILQLFAGLSEIHYSESYLPHMILKFCPAIMHLAATRTLALYVLLLHEHLALLAVRFGPGYYFAYLHCCWNIHVN